MCIEAGYFWTGRAAELPISQRVKLAYRQEGYPFWPSLANSVGLNLTNLVDEGFLTFQAGACFDTCGAQPQDGWDDVMSLLCASSTSRLDKCYASVQLQDDNAK